MSSLLSELSREFISGDTDVVDIITFVEASWGLGISLTPVQKFMLKCMYGLPLDRGERTIAVPDIVNEKILYNFNEYDFLQWLYAEKRCNVFETEGKVFQNLILVWGRRSGKSTISGCISNYEMYKLLKRIDPAKYYKLNPGASIVVLNVAPTDDQAGIVFEMTKSMAMRCPFIRDRSLHQTMTYFDIQTDEDMKVRGRKQASLSSISGGCSSNGLRGHAAIVIIMDEMAFFIDNNGRFSGEQVYGALEPSRLTFKRDGKVICISSPYAKFGKFHELYQSSFVSESEMDDNITLTFKMYSAMVNPERCPTEILKAARRENRTRFMREYGGEFSDNITSWIEDEDEFRKCITLSLGPSRGVGDVPYYYGIDLGFKNDGTAVSIVHKDQKKNKIVLDYAEVWYSGASDVWERDDSIYRDCNQFANMDLLRMNDIVAEIKSLVRWFPAKFGIFDQHNGYALAELFIEEGLSQFEMVNFTGSLNSEVYQLAKRLYAEELFELFDHPVLIPEMLALEAENMSGGKVNVRAPIRMGSHDDISDSFVRAVWKCYNGHRARPSNITTGAGGGVNRGGGRVETQASFNLNRLKNHGEHPRGLYNGRGRVFNPNIIGR